MATPPLSPPPVPSPPLAVSASRLTRRFGPLTAVDGLDLAIPRGEIFGLLGPNGAGKTTTISMLATLLTPSAGSALVAGHDIMREKDAVRRAIGLVFQDPSTDEELTAQENMEFHGRLYGVTREARAARIPELLEMVDLADRARSRVKTFSGGMKRRLEIARGFLHHPEVLFLDEPSIGLDPQTRRTIWEYVARLNRESGVTVILTTHGMEEADAVCRAIAIMDHGRIIAQGSPTELKARLGGDIIRVETAGEGPLCERLREAGWVSSLACHEGFVDLTVSGAESRLPAVFELAAAAGVRLTSVTVKKPTLEDVFIHHTGRTIRDESGSTVDHMRQAHRAFTR
jgi:ABC-2 type transport system ATP-binding protein